MKTKYFFGLIALIILVGSGVGFLIYQNQKPVKVKVAIREALNYPFWVAEDKGFFKDKNIAIEKISVATNKTSGPNNKEAEEVRKQLKDKDIDVAVLSTDELFNLEIEYPGSFKAFVFQSDTKDKYSTSLLVGKDSKINSVKELEGKKIAADSEVDHFLLAEFMNNSGVKNFVPRKISSSLWGEYLEKETVNAVWGTETFVSRILDKGTGKKLVENPNNNPSSNVSGAVTNVIVFKNDFINKKGETAKKFQEAMDKVLEMNDSEIREIMVKRYENNQEMSRAVQNRTYPLIQNSSEVDKTLFQKLADMIYEEKYISKSIDTSKLIY